MYTRMLDNVLRQVTQWQRIIMLIELSSSSYILYKRSVYGRRGFLFRCTLISGISHSVQLITHSTSVQINDVNQHLNFSTCNFFTDLSTHSDKFSSVGSIPYLTFCKCSAEVPHNISSLCKNVSSFMTKHLPPLQEFPTWPRQRIADRIVIADAKMYTIEMSGRIKTLKRPCASLFPPSLLTIRITRSAERHLHTLGGVGNQPAGTGKARDYDTFLAVFMHRRCDHETSGNLLSALGSHLPKERICPLARSLGGRSFAT